MKPNVWKMKTCFSLGKHVVYSRYYQMSKLIHMKGFPRPFHKFTVQVQPFSALIICAPRDFKHLQKIRKKWSSWEWIKGQNSLNMKNVPLIIKQIKDNNMTSEMLFCIWGAGLDSDTSVFKQSGATHGRK